MRTATSVSLASKPYIRLPREDTYSHPQQHSWIYYEYTFMVHIRGRVSLDKTVRSMPDLCIVWSEEASRSLLELDQELEHELKMK